VAWKKTESVEINTHRVTGSFHWEMKTTSIGVGNKFFIPSVRRAFTDTGTSMIFMPMDDWRSLYSVICSQLKI
jgi:hypothetical protein